MENTVNESAIKKLKLLFTIVDRPKAEFYLDVLSQYEVNCQIVAGGLGTATSEMVDLLGLNPHKAVLVSVIREDLVDTIMRSSSKSSDFSATLPSPVPAIWMR